MSDQWWINVEGERRGPLSESELRKLCQNGGVDSRAMVWRHGLGSWKPLGSIDGFQQAPSTASSEQTQDEVTTSLPADLASGVVAGPWRRYIARTVDIWVLGLLLGYPLGYFASMVSPTLQHWLLETPALLLGWFMAPFILFVEALLFALTGTTIGKALFNVNVRNASGNRLTAGMYLARQARVYWSGLGTGFPLISLFTCVYQHGRVKQGKPASYDEGRYIVSAAPMGSGRIVLAVTVISLVLLANGMVTAYVNQTERESDYNDDYVISQRNLNSELREIATISNESLPMMVDEVTRLDRQEALSNEYRSYFTLVSYPADELDPDMVEEVMRPSLIENACTNPDAAFFRENGIVLSYHYSGNNQRPIRLVRIDPAVECQ
ncbi:hypothetical protein FHR99_003216 [Litorivivens lipolytica]|uniref:RDD family protein n=1 Tax=Litorivivens lipolytica TaxID=1524264 RepID=A0A7W4W8T4_9GAMM|nr:hypothetical protein [Litorivivens lipolytica]